MRKFILASLAFSLVVFSAFSAQAQGHHRGGFHGGGFRPQVNPFFFGIAPPAPVYIQPHYGNCYIRRVWVETPYGLKKRRMRFCD